ncbi:MAG TPA: hypothetical protein VF123_20685 [Candidatus Sulfotelmatobacter sp.]
MKQLAAIFCLALCLTAFGMPAVAQKNKPAYPDKPVYPDRPVYPESRAARRATRKHQKAEEKYLRKQKKAQDKMYRESVKKSHLPKHSY